MTEKLNSLIAAIGINIGKNSLHVVGLYGRGASSDCQNASSAVDIGAPRLGSSEIALIRARLSHGSCRN